MKLFIAGFITAVFIQSVFPQVENVPAGHQVYPFLKRMQVKGALPDFDDMIVPLSKNEVISALDKIEGNIGLLSEADKEFLYRMKEKFSLNSSGIINILDNFPSRLGSNLVSVRQKHLYSFIDSSIAFFVDPVLEFKYIYSASYKSSGLLNAGGVARGSYGGWFGFYLAGSNGTVYNRGEAAETDKRVAQSYTFNKTGINFFDETEGYLRLHKDIVNFQLGRERILWGRGSINKMILSDNPQPFDFIKFDIAYKTIRYDFIHAWLVLPRTVVFLDSLQSDARDKGEKYFAASRLSYTPNSDLSFGISQVIIYANRAFEAAYLNPFLFWESAQRSLGDLDNSFLSLDARYKILNGLEISSAILIDDVQFGKLFKNWSNVQNRIAWQVSSIVSDPVIFPDFNLKLEYLQIRPYIFAHPGQGEALTYTNNSYLLGFDLPPNSVRFSAEVDYLFSGKLNFSARYDHSIHGRNIYDESGRLIKNVGGGLYENFWISDSQTAPLLDGDREVMDYFSIELNYELLYGLYFNLFYQYRSNVFKGIKSDDNIFWAAVKINFE
ncbi:MAG: capsule assembly Wzi family protein [Ignavibacteria bacterium]